MTDPSDPFKTTAPLEELQPPPGVSHHDPSPPPHVVGAHRDLSAGAFGEIARTIGRYQLIRILGEGTFGRVYLARDDDLDRSVAIKVPNPERLVGPEDIAAYLAEARVVANLDHPNIVPVYDVGRTSDSGGLCYVVSKYIEGSDLARRICQVRLPFAQSTELIAAVGLALHHAHTRNLVHRDIKPANILVDLQGKPFVADFGLALKDEDFGKGTRLAGTPAYMSPEQARGESHRVDGRSDIFSLGIVFYELLTGRRPFRADTNGELLDQIARADPRPPRQIDDTIPRELERICHKALAKRASERYITAHDLADDLRDFLRSDEAQSLPTTAQSSVSRSPSPSQDVTPDRVTNAPVRSGSDHRPIKVVPKGLRSFDQHDGDFFLDLLPGARDRDGLPESLRFWKTRIDANDSDTAFKVGMIYGPSGCGKSSLLKAGLVPLLSKGVLPIVIESTFADTEARLLRGLRKAIPALNPTLGLVDSLAALRRGRMMRTEQKVLLLLDQFEQWLFARRGEENTDLVAALRHCDGEHLQAIVTVRDDFWLAASRFMRDLEIDLEPNANIALVDLFDLRHARKVLGGFGQAYGTLSEKTAERSRDHNSFIEQAVSGLAQDGKVIAVRLALFADMVKSKPWTPATLREIGGTRGVGVTFLEETFASPQANPKHRVHQKAAQAVLKALLPQSGTDIKGQMRSEKELLVASGYAGWPRDFDDLVRILDAELRLITPIDPEGTTDESAIDRSDGEREQKREQQPVRCYQLTHDYLVHSLRDWLTRKQRETRRGRAELRLAERASLWNAKPENRQLPSLPEWAAIRLLTPKRDWNDPECRMMRQAGRVHGLRSLGSAMVVALLMVVGFTIRNRVVDSNRATVAAGLVEQVKRASLDHVPGVVAAMKDYRKWVDPELTEALARATLGSPEELHVRLALLPVDRAQAGPLFEFLLQAGPSEAIAIREALNLSVPAGEGEAPSEPDRNLARPGPPSRATTRFFPPPSRAGLVGMLWAVVEAASNKTDDDRLLPASSTLALFDPESRQWSSGSGKVADAIVRVNPAHLGGWMAALKTVRSRLTAPLAIIARDAKRPGAERALAVTILADYAADDGALLASILMELEPAQYAFLYPAVERRQAEAIPLFEAEIKKSPASDSAEQARDQLAERQARAAISLIRIGRPTDVWPLLHHRPDPRLRSLIINWLMPLGADPGPIALELRRLNSAPRPAERAEGGHSPGEEPTAGAAERANPADDRHRPGERSTFENMLFNPDTSARRALILSLGAYRPTDLSPSQREPLITMLVDLYHNDPDPGIHAAAEWTIRKWNEQAKLEAADAELRRLGDKDRSRRWYVNGQIQTFVRIEGPVVFRMGSPRTDTERFSDEPLHEERVPSGFAIATKEVTLAQYRKFTEKFAQFALSEDEIRARNLTPDSAVIGVSWFIAAAYCNWLSEQERIPREEWCYLPKGGAEYASGMTVPADILKRKGYRLPTEAEWELACRAGALSSRYYAGSVNLLDNYAWYIENSDKPSHVQACGRLIPNDLGLFDMLGNAYEWCQDRYGDKRASQATSVDEIIDEAQRLLRGGAFNYPAALARSAYRGMFAPTNRGVNYGFRVARTYN